MSYDITIASDERFSSHYSVAQLRDFLEALPRVSPNGDRCYSFGDSKRQWMEIDLEYVSEDGDWLEEFANSDTINCVRVHIPYQFLGSQPDRDYFPTVLQIADHIGWNAIDDQTGSPLEASNDVDDNVSRKPWWRFW